jgi:hypothetical protein
VGSTYFRNTLHARTSLVLTFIWKPNVDIPNRTAFTTSTRDSSSQLLTRLRTGRPKFDSRLGQPFFLFTTASRPTLRLTQPPIQQVLGGSFPGERSGCEVDHSHLPSAEVKNVWSYTSTAPYVFMAWHLVKYRNSFIIHLPLYKQHCRESEIVSCIYLIKVIISSSSTITVVVVVFQGLGLLDCPTLELIFLNFVNLFLQLIGRPGRGIGRTKGLHLNAEQHKHRKTQTHIHASSGIRTHDPSVRVTEDSTCLRMVGH